MNIKNKLASFQKRLWIIRLQRLHDKLLVNEGTLQYHEQRLDKRINKQLQKVQTQQDAEKDRLDNIKQGKLAAIQKRLSREKNRIHASIQKVQAKLDARVLQEREANTLELEAIETTLKGELDQDKREALEQKKEELQARKRIEEVNSDVHLSISQLTMRFGGLKAVDSLSFEVKKGEIFGLIGPNGAGKTTVFNCITQFYKPSHGKIYFKSRANDVKILDDYRVHEIIKLGIVRTFQNVELVWELTVLDNLLVAGHTLYTSGFFAQLLHTPKLKKEEQIIKNKAIDVLKRLDLIPYMYAIPYGLPYGILKRIELARTLMTNPEIIILDEPAAGLNDSETKQLAEVIKKIRSEFDCTIFLVEHDMELVMDICDTICAISFGKKLAIGKPSEIQQNKLVQEAYLGGE